MTETADTRPLVELARVIVERDDDGQLVYSAQCDDWLSLHTPADIATMLMHGADALDLLARHFDPDVDKAGDPAPVVRLASVRQPEGDDDERPDQPA